MNNNVIDFKRELFESLEVILSFESLTPITAGGFSLKSQVLEHVKGGGELSLMFLHNTIRQCQQTAKIDASVKRLYESMMEKLSTSAYKFNLALVHETLENSNSGFYNVSMTKDINRLLGESEGDVIKALQMGEMRVYSNTNKAVGKIVEGAKQLIDTGAHVFEADDFKVYNPVSYVTISEANTVYALVGDYFLNMNESGIHQCKPNDPIFESFAKVVASSKFDYTKQVFVVREQALGNYEIGKDGIFKENAENVMEKITSEFLLSHTQKIVENLQFKNSISANQGNTLSEGIDYMIALSNSFGNIKILDNINVVESRQYNEKFMIGQYNGTYCVGVLSSNRFSNGVFECETITDAITKLYEMSGYDISEKFNKEISFEKGEMKRISESVSDTNTLLTGLQAQLKEVNENLALVGEGSEAQTTLLEVQEEIHTEMTKATNHIKMLKEEATKRNEFDIGKPNDKGVRKITKNGKKRGVITHRPTFFKETLKKTPKPKFTLFNEKYPWSVEVNGMLKECETFEQCVESLDVFVY